MRVGVVGSQHSQEVSEQLLLLADGVGELPGLAGPAGKLMSGSKGLGMIGSQLGHGYGQGAIENRASCIEMANIAKPRSALGNRP